MIAKPARVFVSSSRGDDSNTGLTEQDPLKTIKTALQVKADTIKLKCGDTFYESSRFFDSSIDKYGEGPRPIMSGFRRIQDVKWEEVKMNVWRLNLSKGGFSGYQVEGSSYLNNIGCFHEYDKDIIHGNRVEYQYQLNNDWDFWQCDGHSKDLPASAFDFVYLYLTSDPNCLKLEVSVNECGAIMYGYSVNGIHLEGFNTGINIFIKGNVTNCRIDAMGGNLFLTNSNEFVGAGNGIQLWVGNHSIKGSVVAGNFITRCYDCGITIQGSGDDGLSPHDVLIRDNLIQNCCQGWEDFLSNDKSYYDNCVFTENIVVNSGNSGFGYPPGRFKFCHIVQNNNRGLKGMQFIDNLFIGGNFFCASDYKGSYKSSKWSGNVCYISSGNYMMGSYAGVRDVIWIPRKKFLESNESSGINSALQTYRDKTGDTSTVFHIVSLSSIQRRASRTVKKYLKTHHY